ncbi:MAG TPA: VLRF1 family aeRF1-type release factor, partial [Trueperaceae bacterium]|nr:VLRF1 family aeRF1-type release factor [Trueperaceae bacterium]
LGQIEELSDYVRLVDTEDWQPYRNARRSPAVGVGVAARGGADVDAYRARLEEASVRLYRAMLPAVESSIAAAEVDRVILVGLPGALGPFRDVMSTAMRGRVVGTVPPPANPDGPPRDWLPLVTDLMASIESEHEEALLDRIRESGVWGVQQTLSLLQEHRIQTLVVPWNLTQRVRRDQDGRVTAAGQVDRDLEPGETSEDVPLLEVLPGLVEQTGATLEFVEGANEVRLNDEFGGMAGVTRW